MNLAISARICGESGVTFGVIIWSHFVVILRFVTPWGVLEGVGSLLFLLVLVCPQASPCFIGVFSTGSGFGFVPGSVFKLLFFNKLWGTESVAKVVFFSMTEI